jgi:hypothetical protein
VTPELPVWQPTQALMLIALSMAVFAYFGVEGIIKRAIDRKEKKS